MLSQLTIRNFAIIDRLQIDWHRGLNVITGETGAGKSILIDAVGALLGDRLGPDMVRAGADRALVEGVFELPAMRSDGGESDDGRA
jgi:DNA repair protein RecN (Recombination protein N)